MDRVRSLIYQGLAAPPFGNRPISGQIPRPCPRPSQENRPIPPVSGYSLLTEPRNIGRFPRLYQGLGPENKRGDYGKINGFRRLSPKVQGAQMGVSVLCVPDRPTEVRSEIVDVSGPCKACSKMNKLRKLDLALKTTPKQSRDQPVPGVRGTCLPTSASFSR